MPLIPAPPDPAIVQNLDLRCRVLEIDKEVALWRCEKYRELLLGGSGDSIGHSAAERTIVSSSSHSGLASGSTALQQQPLLPGLVAQQDDEGRAHHQRTLAHSETVPPRVVPQSDLEPEGAFVGIVAALCADNSPRNRAAIFSAAKIGDHLLEPPEAACARKTPDITWRALTHIFGGQVHSERPRGSKVPEYSGKGNLLCTSKITQPFAPTYTGEPGVILSHPDAPLLATFQMFSDLSGEGRKIKLHYCGTYVKVHSMDVQIDEWHALPGNCRRKLLFQLRRTSVGDVHARCNLRKRKKFSSDPSPAEIREWSRRYRQGTVTMCRGAVQDAFESGAEKYRFDVIQCTGYDMRLAELIRKGTK